MVGRLTKCEEYFLTLPCGFDSHLQTSNGIYSFM